MINQNKSLFVVNNVVISSVSGLMCHVWIPNLEAEIIFSSVFIDFENNPFSYSSKMTAEEMSYFQNGKPIKKRIDIKTVFINPFDSYGFHTNSSDRREWISCS